MKTLKFSAGMRRAFVVLTFGITVCSSCVEDDVDTTRMRDGSDGQAAEGGVTARQDGQADTADASDLDAMSEELRACEVAQPSTEYRFTPPYAEMHGCHVPTFVPEACLPLVQQGRYVDCSTGDDTRLTHNVEELPCGACDDPEGYHCTLWVWPACDCDGDPGGRAFVDTEYSVGYACMCLAGTWQCWIEGAAGSACGLCKFPDASLPDADAD